MKLAIATVTALAATAVVAHRAAACGVPDLGGMLADVAQALSTTSTPVHVPLVIVGGGATTEGSAASVSAGYGWGTKETGFLAMTTISRVLLGVRTDGSNTAVSATYGWYATGVLAAGFDLGVEEEQMSGTRGLGPTARLTLGVNGVSLRFTGGASFGEQTRGVGAAELVLDVMDLNDTL